MIDVIVSTGLTMFDVMNVMAFKGIIHGRLYHITSNVNPGLINGLAKSGVDIIGFQVKNQFLSTSSDIIW